jgi:hypothetical protein
MRKFFLCAKNHHFASRTPTCPSPGCDAEVRPTSYDPLGGEIPAFERLQKLPEGERSDPPAATPRPAGKHSIRWWAVVNGERVRRTSAMKDGNHIWTATCGCGWDAQCTGPMGTVDQLVQEHKR